jgi:uncharacterized protein involved in oxidation of intracellular sulfur
MANTLFILNDPPYASARSHNALRLAKALVKLEAQAVKLFLIGDAVACASSHQQLPPGHYNVEIMLKGAAKRGAEVGVCGSCMDARGISDPELTEGSRRSSIEELADWTAWAEKVLVF